MSNAIDVAKFFIELGAAQAEQGSGDAMTNLRINKLLYFAQAYAMVRLGHPLFSETIEAWEKGPVVPKVYHRYKHFGKNALEDSPFDRDSVTPEELSLLFDVYLDTENDSTANLVSQTHKPGTPWKNVYSEDRTNVIEAGSLAEYYKDRIPSERTLKAKVIQPLCFKENGTPIFSKEEF